MELRLEALPKKQFAVQVQPRNAATKTKERTLLRGK